MSLGDMRADSKQLILAEEQRTSSLVALLESVRLKLQVFRGNRIEAAAALHHALAADAIRRRSMVSDLLAEFRRLRVRRRSMVSDLLAEFRRLRDRMAAQMQAESVSLITRRRAEVTEILRSFRLTRAAMAISQRRTLNKEFLRIKTETGRLLTEARVSRVSQYVHPNASMKMSPRDGA